MTEPTADRTPAASPAGVQPICDAIADGPESSLLMCDLLPGDHIFHYYRLYGLYWRLETHA